MKHLLRIFLTIILFSTVGFAPQWTGRTAAGIGNAYYISPSGNDANPGTLQNPWRTIHKASLVLQAGDAVYLRGGTYRESTIFHAGGTQTAQILLAGYPGETAIIDGNNYLIPSLESGNALLQIYGDWFTIRDLTVTGSGDQGVTLHGAHDTIDNVYSHHNWGWGILMTGNDDLTQNSRIWSNSMMNEGASLDSNWSGGVTCARYPDRCTIHANRVWENWGEGISTFESLHTTITGNVIHDNETNIYISDTKYALVQGNFSYCSPGNPLSAFTDQNALLVYDELGVPLPLGPGGTRTDSSDNRFMNNIFMGCTNNIFATQDQAANNLYAYNTFVNSTGTRAGYNANVEFVTGSAPNQRFTNNLIYQSDSIAIVQVDEPGVITFSHNCWSKSPPTGFHVTGPGDRIGNPLLKMQGSMESPGWYELTSSSPAIDAGAWMAETNVDFYGLVRGVLPDIGAFEYAEAPAFKLFLPLMVSLHQ